MKQVEKNCTQIRFSDKIIHIKWLKRWIYKENHWGAYYQLAILYYSKYLISNIIKQRTNICAANCEWK